MATENLGQLTESVKQQPWSLIRIKQPEDRGDQVFDRVINLVNHSPVRRTAQDTCARRERLRRLARGKAKALPEPPH